MRTRNLRSPNCKRGGFTFIELLVTMGIFIAFTAGAIAALVQFNRYAMASRLRVHAIALAQERVDEILTANWRWNAPRPAVLTNGSHEEKGLALDTDDLNEQTGLSSIFTPLVARLDASRTVEIADVTARTLRATVTVTYRYGDRDYSVSLTTMRATDTI